MKKISIFLLLAAFFMPLAMNAQTRVSKNGILGSTKTEMNAQNVELKKRERVLTPDLEVKSLNRAISSLNVQNGMLNNGPVQYSNLESRNLNTMASSNATNGRGTRDVQYEKVTSELSDWSGNYILGVSGSDFVYAFDGDVYDASSYYGYNVAGFTELDLSNNTISDAGDAAILTFEEYLYNGQSTGFYSILVNDEYYLGSDSISGLKTASSLSSLDYLWEVYWYSNANVPILFSYSDGSECYGIVFYNENDGSSTYGGFSNYELSYSGSTFSYYYTGLFKETTSSGGGSEDCDYEKVTASQTDWSGDYVITYVNGSTAYVLSGSAGSGTQTYGSYITATVTDNILANADVADYNVTIEAVTYNNQTKYTVKLGNNYLGYTRTSTSSNNYLNFATSIPTTNPQQYYWTIAYSGSTLTMTNVYNTRRVLKWNSSSPRFACYTSGQNAITLFKKLTECEPSCPAPTNLTYSNVTGEGATLAWDGEADSYSIHIGPAPKTYDFEDGSLQGWSAVDNDGDGDSWFVMDNDTYSGSHGGDYYVFVSYNESSAVDDWLISPQVQLGGSISFWIKKLNNSNYHDYYRVYVSTTNTDISSFSEITSGTIEPATSYSKVSYDLSSYSGAGYIAIRHTAAADQAYLFVDDITITEGGQTIPNVTSPYIVTGLNSATEYEWQVMGDCGDGDVSQWSTSSTFTTLDLCVTPTDLSSDDITNNSAALSWTGLADTYNIQYREYDATAPVTVILTAGDVWGDGSGYQMLLDADATAYDNFSTNGISDYSIFEYKIPTNADYNANTSNVVVNSSVSIQIPAGTYDCFIANPTPGSQVYVAGTSGNVGGRIDNYVFEAGLTYEFVPSRYGSGDGVDVTITGWTPVSGTVTSPYTLTGLNPGTTYAWQVQGEDCDNWSASNVFTTLNGTLVTSITADNVTVLVGDTASITNLVVLPADATNPAVTYTSNDETIATVDANGVVTGVGVGTTTITIAATDGSGVTGTINVTVNGIDVTGITAGDDITIMTGETATISYTVAPANATDQSVTFTSANTAIATVDADGVVTGVGVGETTITIASVSNPEVTATITVTVTSNPNAVQFTVNAPATAQPGDVITVEAVLAAPTNGTYAGFTDLGMELSYDATAFAFVAGSLSYLTSPVGAQAQQYNSIFTTTTNNPGSVTLGITCYQEGYYVTAEGVVFSAQFTVLEGAEGNYNFTAEPNDPVNFDHEGTLISYEATPSTVVISDQEAYVLNIDGYGTNPGGYYLIATPIGEVNPASVMDSTDVTRSMVSGNYDLYYFDDDQEKEWINYKAGTFNLEPGKGYLYANKFDIDLVFSGAANTEDIEITLHKSETNGYMAGWNLVGNPYAETAYLADGRDFYTMNSSGTLIVDSITSNSIQRMEGVFVVADHDGETIHFTTTEPTRNDKSLVLNLTQGRGIVDRAIIRFGEGRTLPKFQIMRNTTKVYIPVDNQDYAVVRSEEVGEMPVSFKAEENGVYTLSFSAQNTEFGYLHLIDNLTGNEVDLLATPSYSFEGKTTDYTSRFKLVYATGNATDDNFAFFSNGSFVINNEGKATLQVIDINGRILSNETINGCANVNVNAASGVYMLRLVNGDNVKVQKVVVR